MAEYGALYGFDDDGDDHNRTTSRQLPWAKARIRSKTSCPLVSSSDTVPLSGQNYLLRKPSWIEVLLRALGLSLLWNGWRKLTSRPKIEVPKQAMRRDRPIALLTLTTHVVPIGAAIGLVYLTIRGYYIGGELAGPSGYDDLRISGLQFAAKLHEIMMQSSLSLVVVTFIRHELTLGKGIPFGAIFGSIQFSNITYLWSKEFAGTLKAHFRSKRTKWSLVLLIVLGSVLFVTVGPSSAIAMRPRLDDWRAGGTDFYLNATEEQIWPLSLNASLIPPRCANVTLSTDCISKDWSVISDGLLPFWPDLNGMTTMPESFGVASAKSMKQLYTRQKVGIYRSYWTLATIQMSNLSDAVTEIGRLWINAAVGYWLVKGLTYSSRFLYRNDVTWSIDGVYQPVTMAACLTQRNITQHRISQGLVTAPVISTFCNEEPQTLNLTGVNFAGYRDASKLENIMATYNSSKNFPVLEFLELPVNDFGDNTIGAFVSFPASWPGGSSLVGCALDARWAPSYVGGRRNAIKITSGEAPGWSSLGTCYLEDTKRITVTAEWANYLNPYIIDYNRTVFHEILVNIPTSQSSRWNNADTFVSPIIESILSIMLTNGLASTASSAVPQGILKGCTADNCTEMCYDGNGAWCKEIMPEKGHEFGNGGSIYDLPASADTSKMARFQAHVDINGYAYDSKGTSTRLACAVLLIYCLVAVCHIVFCWVTRLSSDSWDTISEIVALAMQSERTEVLRNTCAGIVSTTIFTNFVKVVKTGERGEHLELVFDHDDRMNASQLVPDEFYE